jgi:hypothetical protein
MFCRRFGSIWGYIEGGDFECESVKVRKGKGDGYTISSRS